MKILIYGINYSPELVGIGRYTGEMASWLSINRHDVRVITAPPYYPEWRIWSNYHSWAYTRDCSSRVKIYRCPIYVPKNPNAFSRILHLLSFAISSLPILVIQLMWRPDIILLVAPPLFCAPQSWLFSKVTGAKSILHIQDFEVDAFFGSGIASKISDTPFLRRIIFNIERIILGSFDMVSTISIGMLQRAKEKGIHLNRLRFLPNWADVSAPKNFSTSSRLLLESFGINQSQKVLLYSGNMGEKQGLDLLLLAAKALEARTELVFLLVGAGASRNHLVKMVKELRLRNVIFAPLQSNEDFHTLLYSVDVHLVIQKRAISDAVLPSKLSNILAASGNSVITADPFTTLGRLVSDYPGIAVAVEPESVDALIAGIEQALMMPKPNTVASLYAKKFLDKEEILRKFWVNI